MVFPSLVAVQFDMAQVDHSKLTSNNLWSLRSGEGNIFFRAFFVNKYSGDDFTGRRQRGWRQNTPKTAVPPIRIKKSQITFHWVVSAAATPSIEFHCHQKYCRQFFFYFLNDRTQQLQLNQAIKIKNFFAFPFLRLCHQKIFLRLRVLPNFTFIFCCYLFVSSQTHSKITFLLTQK